MSVSVYLLCVQESEQMHIHMHENTIITHWTAGHWISIGSQTQQNTHTSFVDLFGYSLHFMYSYWRWIRSKFYAITIILSLIWSRNCNKEQPIIWSPKLLQQMTISSQSHILHHFGSYYNSREQRKADLAQFLTEFRLK